MIEHVKRHCAECEGPLGEAYYDFDSHGDFCGDCVNSWIDDTNNAPRWFLLILHDDIEAGYRAIQPEEI